MGDVQDGIDIIVQIDDPRDPQSKRVLAKLNPGENLLNNRKKLEQNSKVKMNDTFSFTNKVGQIDNNNILAEIAKEDEERIILEKIINKEDRILYLKSEPDWKFLKDRHKLEYGITSTLEKANKKAFTIMEDCKMTEIVDGCKYSTIEIDSEEDQIMKNDLLLAADINTKVFVNLSTSFERSKITKSNCNANLACTISEYGKASLKFRLQPDVEFIKEVKDAIESKDPRNFKKIIEEYGQFIPTEITLGGRAYFKRSNISRHFSEENPKKLNISTGSQASNIKIESNTENLINNINNSKRECFKLVGGQNLNINNFDENIFQPLSENLRKQILLSIGKKILYSNTEDHKYFLVEYAKPRVIGLDIPENILKIIQNKDADCSIFATVIDKKEKDIFNCQVIWSQNEDPRLVIHCIQKKFKQRKCKLRISWMVIGYDLNFNLSHSEFNIQLKVQNEYFKATGHQTIIKSLDMEDNSSVLCLGIPVLSKLNSSNDSLKKNHYVNLPDFTFTILIISSYPNSDDYGILPINNNNKIRNLINSIKHNPLKQQRPKFISLYSMGENCGLNFLKQKINQIKIKSIDTNCDQEDCICKSKKKKSEINLKYAFLNPIEIKTVKRESPWLLRN
ncbi:unnamed protein product [Rhizophagus irregularis]|uniref:Uncharacterized protein n=1 Tax=Rhizophagus irregularis TaxID=588596 RepID=A0A2N1MX22_9GLOM|nr:hypothetical protein RhiirC2_785185 [Rhizophagus irregularis]CAB4395020.1 unnamed protein product [Rhizophagus irregularis]